MIKQIQTQMNTLYLVHGSRM